MTLRILITGSRNWTDREAIRQALIDTAWGSGTDLHQVTVVHGACPTGADQIADELAQLFGCHIERHPADWARHDKAAGPIRNTEMVARGADICLAFPIGESRGTRDCMRQARLAGIPVTNHERTDA